MVVGTIIGASIFVQPSVISEHARSPSAILGAWIIAGAITLIGALICAELASALQRTGGVYVFLTEAWSPAAGFLWGWAMIWVMHTGIIAAIATICARYVAYFIPLEQNGIRAVAVAVVAALTMVNYRGVRLGATVQSALTIIKVAAIAIIVALVFSSTGAAAAGGPADPVRANDLALAVGAGLFAYGGWHMVTYASGEIVDPARTIPRALVIGTLLVTAAYISLNIAYLRAMPIEALIASRSVAADATRGALGEGAAGAVAALVIISTLGAVNGVILAGPRVYYAMACDGLLFRQFQTVHPRYQTPHLALLLQGAWAAVLVATGTYGQLFSRVIYTEWLFFSAMAIGLLILRRRSGYAPLFRLPAAPLLVPLFVAASLAVVAAEIMKAPLDSAIGLGIVVLGLPVYFLWKRLKIRP